MLCYIVMIVMIVMIAMIVIGFADLRYRAGLIWPAGYALRAERQNGAGLAGF